MLFCLNVAADSLLVFLAKNIKLRHKTLKNINDRIQYLPLFVSQFQRGEGS